MTTAQQIIEAGYARSTANDPGKLSTDAELLGRLNRTYQRLFALASAQRPDTFATISTLTLVGAQATVALPADLIEVRRLQNASGAHVHLIPASEIARTWHVAPCVYRTGSALFSRLRPLDPIGGDVLTAWLLLPGTTIVALSTPIDAVFPTRHTELLSTDLALYLSVKDDGRDPSHFSELTADYSGQLAAFAHDYNLSASSLESVHSPVEHVSVSATT